MCGIAGMFNAAGADAAVVKRMCDVMLHRGPDDEGMHIAGPVGIGMRRLSIIDLASGHQPIHNEDKTVWVVLNGEIYNYQELRRDLEQKGHRFYTHSDTETLVHLYEEYGEELVTHLNGMYCFALWDETRHKLVIGRDRVGEKQLYYAYKGGKLVFGSEIKCVLQTDVPSKTMDRGALDAYLTFLYVPAPRTIFQDIHELPPAHILTLDASGLRVRRYWDVEYRLDRSKNAEEFVHEFGERFRRSVRSRLVSDVPLGALLSGGVDSSAVVAAMSEYASGPVKTFCIGYGEEGAYYDERRYAKLIADRFGTEHHEFVVKPEIIDLIPVLVKAFDQPFADSSTIANYYVFRETRRHVKVVLSGLGGDEVGAGYERYVGIRLQQHYRDFPRWLREGVVERLVALLPDSRKGSRFVERVKRFVRTGALAPDAAYLGFISAFDAERRQALYTDHARARIMLDDTKAMYDRFFLRAGPTDVVDRALYTDVMMYLPGDLLTLTDRMSMAHSIEARAPFIDHELIEFMATVPPELKLKGFDKKHLLKQAFAKTLPKEILYRRKQGFTVPLTVWFRNELNPLIRQMLSRERIERTGLFRWDAVQRIVEEHTSLKENHHSRIWALLMFMVWHEQYQPA